MTRLFLAACLCFPSALAASAPDQIGTTTVRVVARVQKVQLRESPRQAAMRLWIQNGMRGPCPLDDQEGQTGVLDDEDGPVN